MDKKRVVWLKAAGRKRYLRILAAILSLCVLLSAFPELSAAPVVFAADEEIKVEEEKDNIEKDIPSDDEKIPGGGLNDNADDTPLKEEEETEESEETEEPTVPDKEADGTEEEDEETADAEHEEDGADAAVQALLARIDALPDAEEYLAAEPDIDDWEGDEDDYEEACTLWMAKLYEYAEEALAIMEEYETLTEEQQAFISGEELAKLTAWTEIAETAGEGAQVMAAAAHSHDGISFDTPLPADGGELPSGNYYLDMDVALQDSIEISSGAEVNLCLNGHRLCRSENKSDFSPIVVHGKLHVYDCSDGEGIVSGTPITGKSTWAVLVEAQGMLTLHSGKITANHTKSVDVYGIFQLYGGTVECTYGSGGTAIDSVGTVIIGGNAVVRNEGGSSYAGSAVTNNDSDAVMTLKDNASLFGTFYGVHNFGTFNQEGGTITSTSTSYSSAGIANAGSSAILNIKGGTVAGGMYGIYTNNDSAILNLSGSPAVSGETADLLLRTAAGVPVDQAKVDATGYTGSALTVKELMKDSGYDGSYAIKTDEGNKAKFKLTNNGWCYSYKDGGLYLNNHTHSYTYAAKDAVITERCTCGHEETATLSLQSGADLTYTGSALKPVTVTYSDGWAGTGAKKPDDSQITYTDADNINAGTATAKLTISGETASFDFTILQKMLTADMVTIDAGPHDYTGNAVTPDITVRDGGTALTGSTDYTVSYADNVNPGTAMVTVTGKGNYTGTVEKTFTIACRELPSGKNLTDYVDVSPSPNADGWYPSDITLTPKDGCSVGETFTGIGDSVVITGETGADGETETVYIRDGEGNIYQTEFTYKREKTPPVIDLDNMTVENGTKDLWNWIIGKKSMLIKIPAGDIEDALSGIEKVTYETAPDSGTGQSGTLHIKDGNYEIALNTEFSGTIRLTAEDKSGNTTQVSLTVDGGKVIAEDYAPIVHITLPNAPQPNADGWYSEVFDITVTVTDDKDSGNNNITSGGIAEIKWKDGESGAEQTVAGLPGTTPAYSKTFAIPVNTDGTHTYYVQATDNAGNESGWQTVTVRLDTGSPEFSGDVSVTNRTQEGADITFTPSEGGKAYWIVSDTSAAPDAQEVVAGAQGGAGKGGIRDVTGSTPDTFTVTGLTSGEKHTVYVVLEDAAGNLSVVKKVTFTTLQKAPEITLRDLDIDYERETAKLPGSIGDAEVYTDPGNPAGSKIEPEADGSLPVEPGTPVYIRYPEKVENGEITPASGGTKIDIPGRPAAPAPKQTAVTDTAVTVTDPAAGEEYILVEKGSLPQGMEPDWDDADKVNETGAFTGLDPNKEYELYVRKKATEDHFASESAKTKVRTYVTIEESNVTGEGAGQTGNTAPTPEAPDGDGSTVTFTGTYGEEYTPVIKVDGKEIVPGEGTPGSEMTWDGDSGAWVYTYEIPSGISNVQITVEFRKRAVTGIAAAPDSMTIYADDAANGSMETLTAYLKDHCDVQTVYDNQTKGILQETVSFATADRFAQKGAAYHYTVSAGGMTCAADLTVQQLTASVQNPDTLKKIRKSGGYTAQEVSAWLPAQVTVTYTGTGYTARTETRAVTWDTSSVGEDFGGVSGEKTVGGTVELPTWATGQDSAGIVIRFENEKPSSGGGSNGGNDNNGGDENSGDSSGGSSGGSEDSSGGTAPGNGKNPGRPAVTPPLTAVVSPADAARTNPPGQAKLQQTAQTDTPDSRQEDEKGQGSATAPQPAGNLSEAEKEQPGQEGEQAASASADDGKMERSSGTVAEEQAGSEHASKCALCHICPTFLGVCYFIWLILLAAAVSVVIVVLKRKKRNGRTS